MLRGLKVGKLQSITQDSVFPARRGLKEHQGNGIYHGNVFPAWRGLKVRLARMAPAWPVFPAQRGLKVGDEAVVMPKIVFPAWRGLKGPFEALPHACGTPGQMAYSTKGGALACIDGKWKHSPTIFADGVRLICRAGMWTPPLRSLESLLAAGGIPRRQS